MARLAHLARDISHGIKIMVENLLIPVITVDQATGGSGTMVDGSVDGVTRNRRVNSCLDWMSSMGGDPPGLRFGGWMRIPHS